VPGEAPVAVGVGVLRIELDGDVEVVDRVHGVAHGEEGDAAVHVRVLVFGIERDRGGVVVDGDLVVAKRRAGQPAVHERLRVVRRRREHLVEQRERRRGVAGVERGHAPFEGGRVGLVRAASRETSEQCQDQCESLHGVVLPGRR
jgi:hypothetical protein